MTLQEICAERREKLGITYQSIADQSDLPLSTVKKYFSADSKAPAITTAGPICKVLGVSLDEYFGITDKLTMSEELLNAKNDTLMAHKKELEKHLVANDKIIHMMWRGVKSRNRIIAVLLVLLCLTIVYVLYLDFNCIQIGFWRG